MGNQINLEELESENSFDAVVKRYKKMLKPALIDLDTSCRLVGLILPGRERLSETLQTTLQHCKEQKYGDHPEAQAAFEELRSDTSKSVYEAFKACHSELRRQQKARNSRGLPEKVQHRIDSLDSVSQHDQLLVKLMKYEEGIQSRLENVRLRGGPKYWNLHTLLTAVRDDIDLGDCTSSGALRDELNDIEGELMQREVEVQEQEDEQRVEVQKQEDTESEQAVCSALQALVLKRETRTPKTLAEQLHSAWSLQKDDLCGRLVRIGRVPKHSIKFKGYQLACDYISLDFNVVTLEFSDVMELQEWAQELGNDTEKVEKEAQDFYNKLKPEGDEDLGVETARKETVYQALKTSLEARREEIMISIEDLEEDCGTEERMEGFRMRLADVDRRVATGIIQDTEDLDLALNALEDDITSAK